MTEPKPSYGCKFTEPGILKFKVEMEIECRLNTANITLNMDLLNIKFYSNQAFPEINETDSYANFRLISLNESIVSSGNWNASIEKSTDNLTNTDVWILTLYHKYLRCDSQGRYDIIIMDGTKEKLKYSLTVALHSKYNV